jgi:hypothetical protein
MDPPGVFVLRGAAVRGLLTTLRDRASTQARLRWVAELGRRRLPCVE